MKRYACPALAILFLILTSPSTNAQNDRPDTLGDFTVISDVTALNTAIQDDSEPKYLYLASGDYIFNAPIVINRTQELFIHGADMQRTRLKGQPPNNNDHPIFQITKVPLFNLTGVNLVPTDFSQDNPRNVNAIEFNQGATDPVVFELIDTAVQGGAILINGPGQYRLQGPYLNSWGLVRAPVRVNHDGADVVIVGGNITAPQTSPPHPDLCTATCAFEPNAPCDEDLDCEDTCVAGTCSLAGNSCTGDSECHVCETDADNCEIYHLWQTAGRVRIYGTGVQVNYGNADFRIEGEALDDEGNRTHHVLAGIRSEGQNCRADESSGLLYVPGDGQGGASDEPVDVLVLNNDGSWHNHGACPPAHGDGRLIDYNAAGNVWLIGNNSPFGAGVLAEGGAHANANVVAFGNRFYGNTTLDTNGIPEESSITGANTFSAGNLFSLGQLCDEHCPVPCPTQPCSPEAQFCIDACEDTCSNGTCTANSECGTPQIPEICQRPQTQFTDDNTSIPAGTIPKIPDNPHDLPLPLRRVPAGDVSDPPVTTMQNAADCFSGNSCLGFYPPECGPSGRVCLNTGSYCKNDNQCLGADTCEVSDWCGLQAAINKATFGEQPNPNECRVRIGKALFIPQRANDYLVSRPLSYMHSAQAAPAIPTCNAGTCTNCSALTCSADDDCFPPPLGNQIGGFIVGEDNDVTIRAERFCQSEIAKTCQNDQDCGTSGNCLDAPTSVFETESLAFSAIQGITFEAASYATGICEKNDPSDPDIDCDTSLDCDGNCEDATQGSTVRLENLEGFGRNTAFVSFHDSRFIGGRHGLGICMNSNEMCDTIMVVGCESGESCTSMGPTFSDSFLGFAVGGNNALHNLAYDVEFANNRIAAGQDADAAFQHGTWSIFHGAINSSRKDFELQGGISTPIVHGVRSTSTLVLDEQSNTSQAFSLLFDHSTFSPTFESGDDQAIIKHSHSNGPIFLGSSLASTGSADPALNDKGHVELIASQGSKYSFKLASHIPNWGANVLGADTRAFEFSGIPCPTLQSCGSGCTRDPFNCSSTDTDLYRCERTDGTFRSCDSGTIFLESCPCNGGFCLNHEFRLVCP
ncbi:MAG: hypothetical protein GY722_29735 [bacterium]|nr:hypothetical protein [bacterium]